MYFKIFPIFKKSCKGKFFLGFHKKKSLKFPKIAKVFDTVLCLVQVIDIKFNLIVL